MGLCTISSMSRKARSTVFIDLSLLKRRVRCAICNGVNFFASL
uniref:Uncharacterized protein n=1 Tax=Cohnella candidum TaxID=2674991 RepID=A0A3G3K5S0_9BACL|nr:hypothetical protein EAV92_21560 [Cohnella candidum]